jgi:pimeloyl-ACP methyl ester carboxylesterase
VSQSPSSIGRVKVIKEIAIRTIGTDLHAQQRGPHPRAVFLHGFGADLHTWDSVWETLGDGVPALRYDLRGFGRSACGENAPYNHVDDISVVLNATSIEQCDLIGVSMGASIALNFTLDHRERAAVQ